ncbi:MAG: hypothetical protein U1E73_07060 [Planctomycetota bacterium]
MPKPGPDPVHLTRHAVATLAYRAGKALRRFPVAARTFRAGAATRTPLAILSHMGDLMGWAERMARGEMRWAPEADANWRAAETRFFAGLAALDRALARRAPVAATLEKLVQGPIADALTHTGQLALLRGLCGKGVRPESYGRADIRVGKVGREQPAPVAEFDGDASRPAGKPPAKRGGRR